jgi:sialate O-acetylesterase
MRAMPHLPLAAVLLATAANADISLPAILSSGMVLQQDSVVALWGHADPGETITITPSWPGLPTEATADQSGAWRAFLPTPTHADAPDPQTLTLAGKNTLTLTDILLGEVWFCSGQSNMEMFVGNPNGAFGGVTNWEEEVKTATIPDLRLFDVANAVSATPRSDCQGKWSPSTPDRAALFSATAFFFGRELHSALKVPIGLITADWGGTPIQAWTGAAALKAQGLDATSAENPGAPSALFNAMVAPVIPYGIRGFLWYQGEANRDQAYLYRSMFPALINDWRLLWSRGELPFEFVQIAPFDYGPDTGQTGELREAQAMALSLPHTGMAVTMDIGDPADIHPRNKQEVGRRLALCALADAYGQAVEFSGPVYAGAQPDTRRIRIRFTHADGLAPTGQPLTCFTIAGKDRAFHPAQAAIDGDSVLVWSDQVPAPVAVRFAWDDADQPNLHNAAGLPAAPFRTDTWPGITQPKP